MHLVACERVHPHCDIRGPSHASFPPVRWKPDPLGAAGLARHRHGPAGKGRGPKLDAKQIEFFEKKIRPVLVEQCYECHSGQAEKVKGGLLLDTRDGIRKGGDSGPAVVPGEPDESLLIKALRHDEELKMPPKKQAAATPSSPTSSSGSRWARPTRATAAARG